jgi:hypothetical protein
LLKLGLSYGEAQSLGAEELLCLLHHSQLEERLAALDRETARIASLPFADPHEQQQALAGLRHQAEFELDRFYRGVPGVDRSQGDSHDQAG